MRRMVERRLLLLSFHAPPEPAIDGLRWWGLSRARGWPPVPGLPSIRDHTHLATGVEQLFYAMAPTRQLKHGFAHP
jgi:hypothetical protein